MEYYFTAQKLAVGYDNRPLIENIDFSLKRGEILTLIGPNGAGKSTILKSIARQLSLVSGTIYLDKSDVVTMNGNEFAKKMAVVLTDKLKTELMTCYDVVATGRYPYTGRFGVLSDEDKKAVDEAMELVNVSQIKDKDFTKISDGQRQRVMLSRAICQQPEIIVLDEPTSYLDIKYKLEFLSILQRLKRQKNLTVIMSLHELDMAKRVSDHILCIDDSMNYYCVPGVVYTNPELASVGKTEEELMAKGIYYRIQKLPMAYSGRFVAVNELGNGLCKLIIDHNDRIIGCHMLGNPASEIIVVAGIAIQRGYTVDEFRKSVFPHPTVGEIYHETLFA